ncbi:MAG: pyridoxal phosphate-dependent aminotransferase [Candidatus Caldatribacteriota bacterium]|nr:pyridoxal phosphate-dependent aminotransferase [Atribacterota bacterium]MDD3031267.1 pyridoxal phosphate-dependent aminotransferase [Atribacterota bacterium]MDD3641013.1 pyridoxal phosphate-dependent aminotransferase [Atribacterota bacterium]MDD4288085.1 pyridoxal phosphate-dependent aminotransferase [Atribacterota bacterium]MDD5635410.1 pyridoxal phosphate-dependent aminotransferase [Atribacterota bacterium]
MKWNQNLKRIKPSSIRKLFDLAQNRKDIISFGIGEPDFITPDHVRDAAKRAIEEGYTHYTPNAGFADLREALAKKLVNFNHITSKPEEVLVTSGGTQALFTAFYTLMNPGDELIVPDPGFLIYGSQVILAGGNPVFLPIREKNNFQIDPDELRKLITTKTKAILLNSPSNPTGMIIKKEVLEEIAFIAKENDLFVISDELYEDILFDGREHLSIASFPEMKERTISIFGFSKSYAMTGWRIAYLTCPEFLIKEMIKIQQNTAVCPNSVTQRAVLHGLQNPQETKTSIERMRAAYQERRDVILKGLNEIDGFECLTPEGAFYAFPNITRTGTSSDDLSIYLLDKCGVVAVPGNAFGQYGEGYLRFSFATSVDMIKKGIERIKKGIKDF